MIGKYLASQGCDSFSNRYGTRINGWMASSSSIPHQLLSYSRVVLSGMKPCLYLRYVLCHECALCILNVLCRCHRVLFSVCQLTTIKITRSQFIFVPPINFFIPLPLLRLQRSNFIRITKSCEWFELWGAQTASALRHHLVLKRKRLKPKQGPFKKT